MEESRAFPPVYWFPEVSAGEVPDEAEVSTEVSGAVETFDFAWVSVSGRIPVSTAPLPELAASSVRSSPVSSSGAGDCFFDPAAIRIITTIAATAMIPVTFFLFMFGSIEGLFRFRCAHLFQRLLDCAVDAKLVEKAGSWYSYAGERIGQGRENVKNYLKDHPEVMDRLEGQLLNQIKKEDIQAEPDIPESDISEIMDLFVDEDGVIIEE